MNYLIYFDPDDLIMSSASYYIGRKTIQTWDFVNRLIQAWPDLPLHVKSYIERDLESYFAMDDFSRIYDSDRDIHPLGTNTDRHKWEELRVIYRNDKDDE